MKKNEKKNRFKNSETRLIHLHIVLRHQSHRYARSAGARCATDAVNVVFRVLRHVHIEYNIDMRYIKATAMKNVYFALYQEKKLTDSPRQSRSEYAVV